MIERLVLLAAVASLASAQIVSTASDASALVTSATDSSDTASATDSSSATTNEAVTHTVDVGFAAHSFQPDVTLANVGDIIEFNFFPTNHSVIRAEYLSPCVPYEMTGRGKVGFDSGFMPVDAILESPPTFRLLVNNTDPIFYYCGAEGSCINWQMVGVINPNASTSLEAHKQAAKKSTFMLLPGEKWPPESADPMASDSATSSSGTASSTAGAASSTDSAESSSSGGSSGLSSGAIAGIAVGGTVAVIGAAALIFFCGRASRRRNAAAQQQQQQPLMHQQNGGAPPFSPGPNNGHMSYLQPYPTDMNKHMSVQSMSMHSPALPGYMPHQQQQQAPGQAGTPLYGPSDALNPGAEQYQHAHGSPQQSPSMVPMYGQQQGRNSMQPYGMTPQSPGPHSPYAAPQPSASPPPPNQYHEMPGAPVSYAAHMQQSPQMRGGSELSTSDAPTLNNQGQHAQQGPPGGIMNFIKQNTGS